MPSERPNKYDLLGMAKRCPLHSHAGKQARELGIKSLIAAGTRRDDKR